MKTQNELLQEVIDFLMDNQQYGDDWNNHVKVLNNINPTQSDNLKSKIIQEIKLLAEDINDNNRLIHPFAQTREKNEELKERNLISYCTIRTLERLIKES